MEDSDIDRDSPDVDGDVEMFDDARSSPANIYTEDTWPYGERKFVVKVPEVRDRQSYDRDDGEFVVARIRNKAKLPTGIHYQAQLENGTLLYVCLRNEQDTKYLC
jgi:hypothetical protein